ncbi:hypothetical protein JCM3765_007315 [Sporobolomyces pararoseus]
MLCSRPPSYLLSTFSSYGIRPAKRRCLSSQKRSIPQPPYKILFFGADKFSCVTLETLYAARKDLIEHLVVVTPPDQRTGRKLKEVHRPPLRLLAESLSIPSISLPSTLLKDWRPPPEFLPSSPSLPPLPYSLLLTASFGHLLPTSLLSQFQPLNALNLHPSILPNYRGAAPIQWGIINGDSDSNWKEDQDKGMGITVQELSREKFDRGRILANQKIVVPENSDFLTLEPILAKKGGELLIKILKDLPTYQENSKPQDSTKVTSAPKLKKQTSKIDWNRSSSIEITRLQRGVGHQYPLWTILPHLSASSSKSSSPTQEQEQEQQQQQLQLILSPIPLKLSFSNLPLNPSTPPPAGSIFYNPLDKSIYITTKPTENPTSTQVEGEEVEREGIEVVKVEKVKKEGGKWIDSRDWWNGINKRSKKSESMDSSQGWIRLE